tara:strand:+ start:447 stop:791 length:345 start_codon:yes stop_codon:yes gene_type:complete
MSLETQIEQLTTAINTLNATLAAANIQPVAKPNVLTNSKPEAKAEPVIIDDTKADATIVSAEELKMLCLQAARAKPGNKDKIKALLLRYDSNKIADLDIKHYVEVFNLIEKGAF